MKKKAGNSNLQNQSRRSRASRLSAAIQRIGASTDRGTFLTEVAESARSLTRARYGAITAVDETGRPRESFVSGLTPEEQQKLMDWSDGRRVFEHFRDLPGALRVEDLPGYMGSLGVAGDVLGAKTLQVTPMRHQGRHVGCFFLGDKEGRQGFTVEDEDVLVLFALQAATAMANGAPHHEESRPPSDLQAVVDTSPVGILTFDGETGRLAPVNQEAKRIVESMRIPARSTEQWSDAVRLRRTDGRGAVRDGMPLAEALRRAELVHTEEVFLQAPDGRSIRALVNARPVDSDNGEARSVVVTLQDLTPLAELERLRAEFLGMVSHELRAPLTSIKGSAATVLGATPVLDPAEMLQFFRIIDEQADHMRSLIGDLLDAGRMDSGTLSVTPVSTRLAGLVDQARNTFLSGGIRHTVLIDLPHDLPPVMADRQRIVQVLNNLLSNASRYSPESSPIRVSAVRDGAHVAVSVTDEGRGVTAEQLPHLFDKYSGQGGADGERGLGGSGLGLAICKGLVEAHGGRIWATSDGAEQGTRITFTVPLAEDAGNGVEATLASSPSLAPRDRRDPTPILVVDDDPQTLRNIRDTLATAGFAPFVTGDHRELPRIVKIEKPQLVLLDLVLPGTDGIELMENVPELMDLPVIFISGYRRDETIARALELGAADYIVKPFSPTELTARIRAVLRRRAESEPFVLGDLAIHYEGRSVTLAGHPVQLTVTEYELLRVLSANAGRITTYDSLIRQVWGGQESGGPELVRTFVKKLRRKLGDDVARPVYIFNERGVGYRMARPDPS